jgi:serine/threonine protein kinase
VFLVRRKRSSNLYALKKIDKKILIENNLHRYIEAEKSILTKIKHPFIIEAYSFLQDFTHLYILLQFC